MTEQEPYWRDNSGSAVRQALWKLENSFFTPCTITKRTEKERKFPEICTLMAATEARLCSHTSIANH